MTPRQSLRLRMPIPLKNIKLGDIVLDVENPLNDRRSYPKELDEEEIALIDEKDLQDFQARTNQADVLAQFAKFFNTTAQQNSLDANAIQSGLARLYRLVNSGDKFVEMKQNKDMKDWLDENCARSGLSAYMVVGLWTYTDTKSSLVHQSSQTVNTTGGSGIFKAGGGVAQHMLSVRTSGISGENVFAVEYRKVMLKWYSRSVSAARLQQGVHEERFWGMRGQGDVEQEDYNVDLSDEPFEDAEYPEDLFSVESVDD